MDYQTALLRARVIHELRSFLTEAGYLEVDTPALSPDLIPENHLDVFRTRFEPPTADSQELYLIPSPEVYLKRLLAEGYGNIFQIARCYRNGEAVGRLHNPEFTMLEWYSLGADYRASLDTALELLQYLSKQVAPTVEVMRREPLTLTVEEAFRRHLGFSLAEALERNRLRPALLEAGLNPRRFESTEELVNFAMVDRIEPSLPNDRAVALLDYPKQIPTLAREIPGTPWCERWELYLGGVELANCYTEETDPLKVAQFFASQEQAKRARKAEHTVDRRYPELFQDAFPACSGAALGVDRLVLAFSEKQSLDEVIYFPFSATV